MNEFEIANIYYFRLKELVNQLSVYEKKISE